MKNLKNRLSGSDLIVYELYDDAIEIVDKKRIKQVKLIIPKDK